MASNGSRRVNSRMDRHERYIYDGNAARKLQAIPQEIPERRTVSRATSRNRAKAKRMSRGYVLYLAVISIAALFMCVRYLKLKSDLTTLTKEIAVTASQLIEMQADNDALYNSVLASVDLENIKKVAMERQGMKYPDEDQIYKFDTAGNSYVRQYRNVPSSE